MATESGSGAGRPGEGWPWTHDNLARFAPLLDLLLVFLVYSNADPGGEAVLVATEQNGRYRLRQPGILPEVDRRLQPLVARSLQDDSGQDDSAGP